MSIQLHFVEEALSLKKGYVTCQRLQMWLPNDGAGIEFRSGYVLRTKVSYHMKPKQWECIFCVNKFISNLFCIMVSFGVCVYSHGYEYGIVRWQQSINVEERIKWMNSFLCQGTMLAIHPSVSLH